MAREDFASLDELFAKLELRARELSAAAPNTPADMLFRKLDPVEVVFARLEIAGPRRGLRPGPRGGVDVRGDGSTEAFLGRTSREIVEPWPGETPVSALRRCYEAKLA